jgi:hypothetical protein
LLVLPGHTITSRRAMARWSEATLDFIERHPGAA